MQITFLTPSKSTLTGLRDVQPGWNRALDFGIKLYPETGLVIGNTLPGAGIRTIGAIVIDFDRKVDILPCYGWKIEQVRRTGFLGRLGARRTRLTIGTGKETFGPRASLRIRWGWPAMAPNVVPYGNVAVRWHERQARSIFRDLANGLKTPRDTGMWPVFGQRQPAPPGAVDRNALPGWEQDPWGMALRSDLVMNRMAIGIQDPADGSPMHVKEPGYNLVRGWNPGDTQLSMFCDGSRPKRSDNETPSAYEDRITGVNRYDGYLPYDGEHLGCALGHVQAAEQCGDPIAQDDLLALAWDAYLARPTMIGGRDNAWRMAAMGATRRTRIAGQAIADATVTAQMPSGAFARVPYPYPFSPSPWDIYGMPQVADVEQLMERDLTDYALGLYGKRDALKRALLGRPWPSVNKFVAVGMRGGAAYNEFRLPMGDADYYPWVSLGVAAWLDLDVPWKTWALQQPTPGGKVCSTLVGLRDQLQSEAYGREQTAMVLAKLWAIT